MSYAISIHGGAGELSRAEATPERERALRAGLASALEVGRALLAAGASALDAVEAAVAALEDDPQFNAGRGAVLTRAGTAELDAAIMDGATLRAGAVAQLTRVKNPIRLARKLLESSPHVFLAGPGAEAFAATSGIELVAPHYFITRERLAQLERLTSEQARAPFGTVGAVARDARGQLAAATSTGGTAGKQPGRIGDSPLIGAGTYADEYCAVSATGHGEWLIRTVQAYDIAARLRYGGATLAQALTQAVNERLVRLGAAAGLIAIDAAGEVCTRHNTAAMFRASVHAGGEPQIALY